jgi:hypothetical protein
MGDQFRRSGEAALPAGRDILSLETCVPCERSGDTSSHILVLILLVGGGGCYGHSTYGGAGLGGVLGLVLVVAVVVWLVGGLGIG